MKKKRDYIKEFSSLISPYTFGFASSPHLAASLEKRVISAKKIKESFKTLSKRFDFVIVEGIGGALVPFNKKDLIIDIAKELRIPVLVVAGNKLGAINHTLLTIEAIKKRGMKIQGIIFNNLSKGTDKRILKDNPCIIERIAKEKILGALPRSKNKDLLYKRFLPIGRKMLNLTKKD